MTLQRDDIDFGRSRAILLSTSRYDAGFGNQPMPAAANSLRSMRAVLQDSCGWPADRIVELVDQSTRDVVLQQIVPLIHEATEVLLLYYVGHGQLLQGNDLGLALTDTREEAKLRASTSLRLKDLRPEIEENCDAQVKLLILDCCCSGIATKYAQGPEDMAMKFGAAAELEGEGTYTWTACGHSQDTYFEPGDTGLTYFTRFLTETVQDGIPGKGQRLRVREIHDEIRRRFRETPLRGAPVKPEPTLSFRGKDDAFGFAPNAAQRWLHPEYEPDGRGRRPFSRPRPVLAPSRSALLIANGNVEDDLFTPLTDVANQIKRMRAVLADLEVGGFTVTVLLDETADVIRRATEDFLEVSNRDALALIHLLGHGFRDPGGSLFYAAKDTRTSRTLSTAVNIDWLLSAMDSCQAREQILILDTAYAGAFARGRAHLGTTDRVVLAGTSATGMAYSNAFTAGLVEALEEGHADEDGDGFVSVEDVFEYARDHIVHHGYAQSPQRWIFGATSKIWLARSPQRRPQETNQHQQPRNVHDDAIAPGSGGLDPGRCVRVMVHDGDSLSRVGSGYLISNRMILTTASTVSTTSAGTVAVEFVYPAPKKVLATLAFVSGSIDVAVLCVLDGEEVEAVAAPRYGRLEHGVMACQTLGFPRFKLRPAEQGLTRDSHLASGSVSAWSNLRSGTLSVHVAPPGDMSENESPWSGMSGAAVWVEDVLVGMITEHYKQDGLGTLTATRIDRWYQLLGADELIQLHALIGLPQNVVELTPL